MSVLVLGHGAGGGVTAPDLVAATKAAQSAALSVALVEQPYRVAGRRSPAPANQLDTAWTAVLEQLRERELGGLPLLVGGRSAGARVACRTAEAVEAVAVICLAFPLHPPGKGDDPIQEPVVRAGRGSRTDARRPGRERSVRAAARGPDPHGRDRPGQPLAQERRRRVRGGVGLARDPRTAGEQALMGAALGWGVVAASSLVLGALLGLARKWPDRLVGLVLAFGAGALISAVSFELFEDGIAVGGAAAVGLGLAAGALTYFALSRIVETKLGDGGGPSLALGAFLDGIPEQLVLGIGIAAGEGVSISLLVAIFVSNLPEAIGSATDMRESGTSRSRFAASGSRSPRSVRLRRPPASRSPRTPAGTSRPR